MAKLATLAKLILKLEGTYDYFRLSGVPIAIPNNNITKKNVEKF